MFPNVNANPILEKDQLATSNPIQPRQATQPNPRRGKSITIP